jgi:hypothetical protein
MQGTAFLHALLPENSGNLDKSFRVVIAGEEGKAASEEAKHSHADGPDVEGCGRCIHVLLIPMKITVCDSKVLRTHRLIRAFEHDFRRSEASCTRSVGSDSRSGDKKEDQTRLIHRENT